MFISIKVETSLLVEIPFFLLIFVNRLFVDINNLCLKIRIYAVHVLKGGLHRSKTSTIFQINQRYCAIAKEWVEFFVENCVVCQLKSASGDRKVRAETRLAEKEQDSRREENTNESLMDSFQAGLIDLSNTFNLQACTDSNFGQNINNNPGIIGYIQFLFI